MLKNSKSPEGDFEKLSRRRKEFGFGRRFLLLMQGENMVFGIFAIPGRPPGWEFGLIMGEKQKSRGAARHMKMPL